MTPPELGTGASVVVLTHLPSPYQVEFFDAIASQSGIRLHVVYLHRTSPDRRWTFRGVAHEATFLDAPNLDHRWTRKLFQSADLVVINYYRESSANSLFKARVDTGLPWCFWGERPGFRTKGVTGYAVRRWTLRWLHRSQAPIWGIGQFAVDGYRAEFGSHRPYINIPYFSNLQRFHQTALDRSSNRPERIILFSGALTHRKGVDLLARAIVDVGSRHPALRLHVLGDGKLRQKMERTLAPVRQQVEFLGFRDWAALPTAYKDADILCVPSRYDGWGLIVPEGLAAGLPVIASDRMGAAREFLVDGHNGWIVPAGDSDALRNALEGAVSLSPDSLAEMSDAARASVEEHSLASGARRFAAAARDVMSGWGT